ncbi:cytochrome P450 [Nemania diffusa]|nr:cytochrome P450 [Nemania diffusa]
MDLTRETSSVSLSFVILNAIFGAATLYIAYTLLLHPLRKYPGPLLGKITNLYAAVFAIDRRLHQEIWRNHKLYGSVVRIGPDRLVFESAAAMRDIYQNERLTKPSLYLSTQARPDKFSVWNALDRNLHHRQRRLVGQVTADASMRSFEPEMLEQVDVFLRQIGRNSGKPLNMEKRCSYLSYDIIGLLALGYALHLQTIEKSRFLLDLFARANHCMNVYMQLPFIAHYRLHNYLNKVLQPRRAEMTQFIKKMFQSRIVDDIHEKRDLYSVLSNRASVNIKADDDVRQFDVWYEIFFFIIAGGDTSSTALCSVLFYLARHQRCYDKLASEVRKSFQHGHEIRNARLGDLEYLRACINEALRMSPPVPGTLWRRLAPDEEKNGPLVIDGHVIPPGTNVGINIYSLHHNETYFEEPFVYKPERWLDGRETGNQNNTKTTLHDAFGAFSLGSRGCSGKSTAYMEIGLTLVKVLWYFDFEAPQTTLRSIGEDQRGEFRVHDIFTTAHDGPYLIFSPRETFHNDLAPVNPAEKGGRL